MKGRAKRIFWILFSIGVTLATALPVLAGDGAVGGGLLLLN